MSVGVGESIYVECHSEEARDKVVNQYASKGYKLTNQQEAMVATDDEVNNELRSWIILTFTLPGPEGKLAGRVSSFPQGNKGG